jgi:hypothetical protein
MTERLVPDTMGGWYSARVEPVESTGSVFWIDRGVLMVAPMLATGGVAWDGAAEYDPGTADDLTREQAVDTIAALLGLFASAHAGRRCAT